MNLQLEIESLQSDIRKLQPLQDRVHSLEVKLGNINVGASLESDAQRISNLEEWFGTMIKKVAQLEDFQDTVENWMRRVESLLKEVEPE